MVVNKNSWHYKFWSWTYHNRYDVPQETNLCNYCQRIFWLGLMHLFLGSMVLFLVLALLYAIFVQGFYYHTGLSFIILGAIVAVIGGTLGYAWWADSREYREPGLVGQWVSAKKQKICPLVEFEYKE
jgi:hypothetical protein